MQDSNAKQNLKITSKTFKLPVLLKLTKNAKEMCEIFFFFLTWNFLHLVHFVSYNAQFKEIRHSRCLRFPAVFSLPLFSNTNTHVLFYRSFHLPQPSRRLVFLICIMNPMCHFKCKRQRSMLFHFRVAKYQVYYN